MRGLGKEDGNWEEGKKRRGKMGRKNRRGEGKERMMRKGKEEKEDRRV